MKSILVQSDHSSFVHLDFSYRFLGFDDFQIYLQMPIQFSRLASYRCSTPRKKPDLVPPPRASCHPY